ncbi:hypothetical protein SKAU_G00311470 [Synaphobranchus kaupii]|uniref:Uncharacterized protein n=1 Tax=Synaphobranchus kaupii TaxID=118154 RepID=A0A9Q1ERY1_SYNKA|nr:hypothetical protein SKAU_G00311470 [Synaphobranchus kaupii]
MRASTPALWNMAVNGEQRADEPHKRAHYFTRGWGSGRMLHMEINLSLGSGDQTKTPRFFHRLNLFPRL